MKQGYFNEKEKKNITSLKKRITYLEGEVFGKALMIMGKKELLEKIKIDFKDCWKYELNHFESKFDHELFEKKLLKLEKTTLK